MDLVLMSLFFGFNIRLYYLTDEGLLQQTVALLNTDSNIQLYLNPDSGFDVVYSKAFIRNAGICQSLVLEVKQCHQ